MRPLTPLVALIALLAPAAGQTQDLSLEQRVQRLERTAGVSRSDSSRADMVMGLQELREEMSRLRGELEVQGHRLKELERRQRELYLDMDRRLSKLTGAEAQEPARQPPTQRPTRVAPTLPDAPAEPGPGQTGRAEESRPTPRPPSDPAEERARYEAAFEHLSQGRYEEASRAFQAFLEDYPDGAYADNARYWLGETAYVRRDFDKALAQLERLVEERPVSPTVPDALLKIGFVYYELGQWSKARETLEEVEGRFPTSTAAQLARQRLQRMSREGH